MEEQGKVVENSGRIARVLITRHSACSKCDKTCPLSEQDSHDQDQIIMEVENEIGAVKGEQVKLEMEKKNLVFASLIIYIIPIINMIAGYFLGDWMATKANILSGEGFGILSSILFLEFSFIIIRLIDTKFKNNKNFEPVITQIIRNNKYI
ncbi:SoxR reducing system RseC family protein [Halanaerobium congolense]|jgi:sigma-E factor negative regulatory protein RseC|uniref:RseC/MucC-like positive regulator of sigma(E) n=1 Tax=Halanaerobium congolense TaxID=54121 RepID=A0A1M7L935_9FIRM|nr:SoxR reducing system RseC family protein [Halanaerobium congolense]PXV63240.1 RseC/MucC-like positive regulator of sigma(E) [Halanaerobium congolense]TDX39347.1 RseC/MucC-like positive regulator of sigma(E) [Halanaerobium congolense]SHM74566.1 positive regulator of sigma(E), RseC/MucC [Halanaerobium congolense]